MFGSLPESISDHVRLLGGETRAGRTATRSRGHRARRDPTPALGFHGLSLGLRAADMRLANDKRFSEPSARRARGSQDSDSNGGLQGGQGRSKGCKPPFSSVLGIQIGSPGSTMARGATRRSLNPREWVEWVDERIIRTAR